MYDNLLRILLLFTLFAFNINILSADSISSGLPKRLTIRSFMSRPPFEFINENGEPDGFSIDIIKLLTAELGYTADKVDIKIETEEKVMLEMTEGKVDILVGVIYEPNYTGELRFSLPIIPYQPQFVVREGEERDIYSIKSLGNKRIIVQRDSWLDYYAKWHKLSNKIVYSRDSKDAFELLKDNKGDVILENHLMAYYYIKKYKIPGIKIVDLGIPTQRYTFASTNDKQIIISSINSALQNIKANGKYDDLYDKWFGVMDIENNYDQLILVFAVTMGVVLLLLLFIWLLRSKVNSATRQVKYSNIELELAIKTGNIMAWTLDSETQNFTTFHGNMYGKPFDNTNTFYSRLRAEDVPVMRKIIRDIKMGFIESANSIIHMRSSRYTEDYRIFEIRMVHVSDSKRIVGSLKDITDDITLRNNLEDYRIKSDFIVDSNGIVLFSYNLIDMNFLRLSKSDSNNVIMEFAHEEYISQVHPDDVDKAQAFIDQLDMGVEDHLSAEYRMLTPESTYEWFSIEAVAYKRNELGAITSYLGLRRNNTKWKLITEDLIDLRDKAESSNRLKSAFLANMSHEIRTPLNAIVGFSDLITQTDDPEELEQYKSIVNTNNELLLRLVNDILDLSKIESGVVETNYITFNIVDQLLELHSTLALRAPEGVELLLDCKEKDFEVFGDNNRIAQIVTNFVTNAFKFTTHGSVTIKFAHDPKYITISVIDTGIGISEENRVKVFERFEKLNEFAQGTGLGLSICQSLVENMKGHIGVDSVVGKGSTFWFKIPYKDSI